MQSTRVPLSISPASPLRIALTAVAALGTLPGTGSAQVRFDVHEPRHLTALSFEMPLPIADIAAGDVDGDGDLDLLLAVEAGLARLCYQDGKLDYRRYVELGATYGAFSAAALLDVDGDGDLDAVLGGGFRAYGSAWNCALHLNLGNGNFVAATAIPTGIMDCTKIGGGDLDGDGDLDLVLFQSQGSPVLWRNDGGGAFTDITASWLPPIGLAMQPNGAVTDLDGDGFVDVVAPPFWYQNDGTGHLTSVPNWLPQQSECFGVFDLDEDGDLDFLLSAGIYRNDGGGICTPVGSPGIPGTPRYSAVVAADLDGDGHVELAGAVGRRSPHAGAPDQARAFVLRDTGGLHFSDVSTAWLEPHTLVDDNADYSFPAAAAADLNGDGRPDLVLGGVEGRSNSSTTVGVPPRVLVQQPGSRFLDVARPTFPFEQRPLDHLTVGDLDGDGRLEILANGDRLWQLGDDGRFNPSRLGAMPGPLDGRFADLDGDGDQDLLIAGSGAVGAIPSQPHLLRNDGGALTDVTATQAPVSVATSTRTLAIGDVDGDGDTDAVFGTAGALGVSATIVVWHNDGNGVFTEDPPITPAISAIDWHRLELGDLDGDGDLDLVGTLGYFQAHPGADPLRVFVNDGTGLFQEVTAAALPATLYDWELQLLDLDDDGDLDISTDHSTLHNDGTGVFTLALPPTWRIVTADFDQDGTLDEATGTAGIDVAGQGFGWSWGPSITKVGVAGDLDGDGDLDLAVGDHPGLFGDDILHTGVLFNQLRDLRFVTSPQLGAPFELQLRAGNPNGSAALLALGQMLPLPIDLGVLGQLRLDPTTLLLLGVVSIPDPDTAGSWIVSVPATPTLLGLPVAAQALLGDLGLGRGPHLSAAMQRVVLP